jgi:hypothetical protein
VKSLLKSIQYGMLDFIEGDDDPDYTSTDVTTCITLLLEFMTEIEYETQTKESVKNHVRDLVLALNDLNAKCDDCLIETDEREEICEFIFKVIANANVEFALDITEEWRNW